MVLGSVVVAGVASVGGAAFAKPDKAMTENAITILERGAKAMDFDVRAMAVESLGYAPRARALPIVKDALADPQWKVRAAAITALKTLKEGSWEAEVAKSVCDPMVDADFGVLPLLDGVGAKAGVPIVMRGLDGKDCPRPERYVKAFLRKGGDWLVLGMAAGLTAKSADTRAAFEKELPTLPFASALPIYKDARNGYAKYSPELQKTILQRLRDDESVKDVAWVKVGLKSKDADVVFHTAVLLGLRGDAAGKSVLMPVLDGQDAGRRVLALKALAPIASADVFERMKPIIKNRETPYDELILAYAIYMKSGSPKLVSYLEGELENTDVPARAAAVYYLGQVKGRAALADLTGLLGNGPQVIKLAAASAIGRLGLREAIPVLRDALARETNKEMKLAELAALASIKDAEIIPVARFYVTDPDNDIRLAAVKVLTVAPDASSVPDLELAARDRQKEIRELALFTLVDQDPEGRFMLFERAMEWLDAPTFRAFVERHGDKAQRHLRAALASPRDELRAAGFGALDVVSKDLRRTILVELALKSDRPALRLSALDKLVAEEGKAAIPTLETLVKDQDEKMRVQAIAYMGRLGHKPAIEALQGSLGDSAERIRVAAAGALLRL
ncbi:MAG: HEAT repeat domain-containing protein [Myxococcota bacterium]